MTFSNTIIRIVIILILLMLFCMPLFSLETYFADKTSFEVGLKQISTIDYLEEEGKVEKGTTEKLILKYLNFHKEEDNPLIQLELHGTVFYKKYKNFQDVLRVTEYQKVLF